jgi:hypothetical protein
MASGTPTEGSTPNSQGSEPLSGALLKRFEVQDQQMLYLNGRLDSVSELLAQQVATSSTLQGTLGELTTAIQSLSVLVARAPQPVPQVP